MRNRVEILRDAIDEMAGRGGKGVFFFVLRHMYSVSAFAAMLAKKRGLDAELATMTGLLHDIHTLLADDPAKHAKRGSKKAKEILSDLKIVTDEELEVICTAIRNHAKKAEVHDEYSELIKDADVLGHYFANTALPVFDKDKERLNKLLIELSI